MNHVVSTTQPMTVLKVTIPDNVINVAKVEIPTPPSVTELLIITPEKKVIRKVILFLITYSERKNKEKLLLSKFLSEISTIFCQLC